MTTPCCTGAINATLSAMKAEEKLRKELQKRAELLKDETVQANAKTYGEEYGKVVGDRYRKQLLDRMSSDELEKIKNMSPEEIGEAIKAKFDKEDESIRKTTSVIKKIPSVLLGALFLYGVASNFPISSYFEKQETIDYSCSSAPDSVKTNALIETYNNVINNINTASLKPLEKDTIHFNQARAEMMVKN